MRIERNAMNAHRYERGQTIPIWIGGILTSFMLMFFGLNYANAIRWQIRAQNAADAAAQGLLAIQTERWNLMLQTLYAANVEEYRSRQLLNGLLLSIDDSGGCTVPVNPLNGTTDNGQCNETYITLNQAFQKSTARYTTDVQLLNDISVPATNANWVNDVQAMLTHMQDPSHCNNDRTTLSQYSLDPSGGDCAFKYTIAGGVSNGIAYRTGLEAVQEDAYVNLVPGLGRTASLSNPYENSANDSENTSLFDPAEIDIVTCAIVQPLVSGIGPFKAQPYYAVGRAAATAVQVEQDWFEPGALDDPVRASGSNQTTFQPHEIYNSVGADPVADPVATPNNAYDVDFGGNYAVASNYEGVPYFSEAFNNNEMSARMGWWNAIPTKPFAPANSVSLANSCPAS
jgi:hypothetical protein